MQIPSRSRKPTSLRLRLAMTALLVAVPVPAFGQVRHVAHMNTDAIRALDRARTVVILPMGILEQHGPYLPSYTDGYGAERLTNELAEAVAKRPGWTALVFPSIPLGHGGANVIGDQCVFPGSYTIRTETLRATMMDFGAALAEQGFKWVFVVSLHGSPYHNRALDQAADFVSEEYGGTMVNLFGLMSINEVGRPLSDTLTATERAEEGFSLHSGVRETSEMLFLRPDLVRADYPRAPSITGRDMNDLQRIAGRPEWPGYFGAPRLASASRGARSWLPFADRAVSVALSILDGANFRTTPRYADNMIDRDPAAAAVGRRCRDRDQSLAERQRQWLQRKGPG